ncbi:MAG TPA: P-II family nitrogen regulator [Woeseiaceae bacterium]|nr:P-II family nitrogen regulator [Woeseiaceae bacterium]
MSMKEIKAYVHRNRVADVVSELMNAGFKNLAVIDVQGMLQALDSKEQHYSVEIGQKVVTEVKLELVCEDQTQATEAVAIISEQGKTGQSSAGWIYVSDIKSAIEITS